MIATQTQPNVATKKLHEVFMQFSVKITGKSLVKKAGQVIDTAAQLYGASKSSITSSKKLCESRQKKDLANASQSLRMFIRSNTIKLGEYDVIPPARFVKIKQRFNELVEAHEIAKQAFKNAIEKLKQNDKTDKGLGQLYCESDYPSEEEIESSFGVNWVISPLPDMSSLNVNGLDASITNELYKRLNDSVQSDVKAMNYDLLSKLIFGKNPDTNNKEGNGLLYAINKLRNADESRFKENTINNVKEIAEIVKDLNALEDPNIAKLADSIEKIFSVDVEVLRGDDNEREKVIESAEEKLKEIEKSMEGFL